MVGYDVSNVSYVREKNVAHILNEMLLHLLRTHAGDPLPSLLHFLESGEGQQRLTGRKRAPKAATGAPVQPDVAKPSPSPLPVATCGKVPTAVGTRGLHGGLMPGGVLNDGVILPVPGRGLDALDAASTAKALPNLQTLLGSANSAPGDAAPEGFHDPTLGRTLLHGGVVGGGYLNEGVLGYEREKGAALSALITTGTADHKWLALLGQSEPTAQGYAPYVPQDPLLSINFGGVLPGGSFLNDGIIGLPSHEPGAGLAALLSVASPESYVASLKAGDGLAALEAAANKVGCEGRGVTALNRSAHLIERQMLKEIASDSPPGSMLRSLLFC